VRSGTLIVHDCSGVVAMRCVQQWQQHPPIRASVGHSYGELHHLLQAADALLLLLPAIASDEELSAAFQQFRHFLSILQLARSYQRQVGGFPTFLVLTHCDRLAQPGDTHAEWELRVSVCRQRAHTAFADFLRQANESSTTSAATPPAATVDQLPNQSLDKASKPCAHPCATQPSATQSATASASCSAPYDRFLESSGEGWFYLPFGRLDLRIYAVAVRYPAFKDTAPVANTPYQVAELFRDVFIAAHAHQQRQLQADSRLRWTIRISGSVTTAIATLLLVLLLAPPRTPVPTLTELIVGYQQSEPTPAERLSRKHITYYRRTLERFRDHPEFPWLAPSLQSFVRQRLEEIEDYLRLWRQLVTTPAPAHCRSRSELEQLKLALEHGALAIPSGRGYQWQNTEVDRWRQKWLQDIRVLTQAVQQLEDLYRDRLRQVHLWLDVEDFAGAWRREVTALLQVPEPPYPLNEQLPGSISVPVLPREQGAAVYWFAPYHFDEVTLWREEWLRWRARLQSLRDLADACGLTYTAGSPPAPLRVPLPTPASDASTDDPRQRWHQLEQHYGLYLQQPELWSADRFPESSQKRLQIHWSHFVRATGRQLRYLLQQQLGTALTDNLENWQRVAAALQQPSRAIADWGRLLQIPQRFLTPEATDPLQELVEFLNRDSFVIELQGLELSLPADIALEPARPSGPFVLKLATSQEQVQHRLVVSGPPLREGSNRAYIFLPEKPIQLRYHPGDSLRLELPLQAGQETLVLVWQGGTQGSSAVYQFDCVHTEPNVIRSDGRTEVGRRVRLLPLKGSNWPTAPPLWYAVQQQ
jgi:hypothetical protein